MSGRERGVEFVTSDQLAELVAVLLTVESPARALAWIGQTIMDAPRFMAAIRAGGIFRPDTPDDIVHMASAFAAFLDTCEAVNVRAVVERLENLANGDGRG